MPRPSSAVDKHVGARLRVARMEAGKTQAQVADAIGFTFQQIQMWEKGTNRISAGTLHELSRFLDKPVQFFFDGLGGGAGRRASKDIDVDPLTRFGGTAEGMKIVMAFEKADPSLRRMLAQHVEGVVRVASR
jgi:transcriptional regulator with XRE-family HTH domain